MEFHPLSFFCLPACRHEIITLDHHCRFRWCRKRWRIERESLQRYQCRHPQLMPFLWRKTIGVIRRLRNKERQRVKNRTRIAMSPAPLCPSERVKSKIPGIRSLETDSRTRVRRSSLPRCQEHGIGITVLDINRKNGIIADLCDVISISAGVSLRAQVAFKRGQINMRKNC
jgi:hypothetical protein